MKKYDITYTREDINSLIVLTPQIKSEPVILDEEKDFFMRKAKSYISKINITELKQSETLTDFVDLDSKNTNTHKTIQFNTLHLKPFIKNEKELGILLFSTIRIKDKITEDDIIKFPMKYTTLRFIPVKKGYDTLYISDSESTIGLVKEFLESKNKKGKKYKFSKSFDNFCVEDSFLPNKAKNYLKIKKNFYNYPAVCFRISNLDKFLEWVSLKINRKVELPSVEEWSYIATNAKTTKYCWGNQTVDQLIEDEEKPENIVYTEDMSMQIKKVKTFEASLTGIYDMCGNVYELVKDDKDEIMVKGNSYTSFVQKSDGYPEVFSDDLNLDTGLRLFYKKE